MKKADLKDIFENNNDSPMSILFSKSAYSDIVILLGIKDSKCKFCGVHIDKNNVGGFFKEGAVCDNSFCLLELIKWQKKGDL